MIKTSKIRLALISAFALAGSAWAQSNSIQAISSTMENGREVVKIDFKNPLNKTPEGFAIQTPARIALDFPSTGNALGKNSVDLNGSNLKSAQVVEVGERTRVVLNLKQASAYQSSLSGNSLLVSLAQAQAAPVVASNVVQPPVSNTRFAESRNSSVQAIRDMDFRRGYDGAGRLIIDLPSNQVGVDIKQQGAALALEFPRTSLPEGLRRKLDVADFGTPIQGITAYQSGDKVKILVESKGAWTHSAYQGDKQFVLEVRPQREDPNKLSQGVGYTGEKLSLNFQNIEVRSLLQVIADFTNFNIITSDSVNGSLTLRLKDVPWDQALDIILQAKGLGVKKSGNVLWIAPKEELADKEKKELEAQKAIEGLEPLRNQSFQLNYTKAVDVQAQLTNSSNSGGSSGNSSSGKMISERGSVIAEPRTNQLFVSDIPSRLEAIQEMISKLDVPMRQVLIEARIVEASDTFGKSLGVKFGGGAPNGFSLGGNKGLAVGPNFGSIGSGYNSGDMAPYVGLPAQSLGGVQAPSMGVALFNAASGRFLALEISALEADGRGKIVSSPRVITADQTKAIIEQGTEIPYQEASSSGATSVSFKKASLKLEVTPQITPEGSIILDLDVTKDSPGRETTGGLAIDSKHVQTQVLIENGGTIVIGGIFVMEELNSENKVPLLGDIPGVGNLFKNRTKTTDKKELLVFITPKIVSEKAMGSN